MVPGTFFTAPTYINVGGPTWPNDPLIFLAGPIQGASDWQANARDLIRSIDDEIHIASPRRLTRAEGNFTDEMYKEQVLWEHHYLDYASKHGVTLFWCANEEEHVCDRAYAQTTRFELGEAMVHHRLLGARVVAGFDTAYSGTRYAKLTMSIKAPGIPLRDSLEATCKEAVRLCHELYHVNVVPQREKQ